MYISRSLYTLMVIHYEQTRTSFWWRFQVCFGDSNEASCDTSWTGSPNPAVDIWRSSKSQKMPSSKFREHIIYTYIYSHLRMYIYICAFQDVRTNIWIRKYIYFLKSCFDICIYLFTICIFSFNEYRYFRVSQAEASHSTITHTQ